MSFIQRVADLFEPNNNPKTYVKGSSPKEALDNTIDQQKAILAEYTSLKQEITQAIQMHLQATGIALPFAVGAIAYGFQTSNSIAFLVTITVFLSALLYSAYAITTVRTIGAYIYAVIEPKVEGLQWEAMLVKKRREEKIELSSIVTLIVYIITSLVCIFFSWVFLRDRSIFSLIAYISAICVLMIALCVASYIIIHITSLDYYDKMVDKWKRIEKDVRIGTNRK